MGHHWPQVYIHCASTLSTIDGHMLTGQMLTGHMLTGQLLTGQMLTPLSKNRTKCDFGTGNLTWQN